MRVARALVAALVLLLLPAPANASRAHNHVDDVVLVATARGLAEARARPAIARCAGQVRGGTRARGGARPSAVVPDDARILSPRRPEVAPRAPRARLYLVHCALLR